MFLPLRRPAQANSVHHTGYKCYSCALCCSASSHAILSPQRKKRRKKEKKSICSGPCHDRPTQRTEHGPFSLLPSVCVISLASRKSSSLACSPPSSLADLGPTFGQTWAPSLPHAGASAVSSPSKATAPSHQTQHNTQPSPSKCRYASAC